MRAVGLIVEYNPFHNGHLHHLRESLRLSGADVAVAVMSGHFLQRGEPALVDKWVRTEMALACGVDLVVELPFPFACNSAPHFADGAIRLLDALGVDALCFGSEDGKLDSLRQIAALLVTEAHQIREETARQLRAGVDYPTARAALLAEQLGEVAALLATPNNILGIEYLRALYQAGSQICPLTIQRLGAGYHDLFPTGSIASATGLRRMHLAGDDLTPYVPEEALVHLNQALEEGKHLDEGLVWRLIAARLLRGPASLQGLYQLQPGLEQRFYQAALASGNWKDLVAAIGAPQLTRTRVQRMLCHALLDLAPGAMERFLAAGPLYLRLLGSSCRGEAYLAATRKERSLPLLGNLSRASATLRRYYAADGAILACAEEMLRCDLLAMQLYGLLLRRPVSGNLNRDYFEEVRRIA